MTTFVKNPGAGYNRETGAPDNECGNGWGYYDLGLQNENLILKAKELGLDTLIMGIRDAEKIHEMLQIPETEQVVAVIAVGYRDIDPEKPKRKNSGSHSDLCGGMISPPDKDEQKESRYGRAKPERTCFSL